MENILQALKSKTVWFAIAQAFIGVLIVLLTEANMEGSALIIKSLADMYLRSVTNKALSDK
jgi:hypothetical protein